MATNADGSADAPTATESDFLDYFEAMARRFAPLITVAYLRTLRDLARAMNIDLIAQFVASGNIDAAVAAALNQQVAAAAFASVQTAIRDVTARAGTRFYRDTPIGPASATPIARVRFNVLDQNVAAAIEQYESRVFTAMTDTIGATIRQVIASGLRAGVGPRAIAAGLRDVVSLAPNQVQYLANYEAQLETLASSQTRAMLRAVIARGDTPAVLGRTLTDGNIDRTVRSAITNDRSLTTAEIEKAVQRYRKNLQANQAETVSRTVTLNTMREAQRMAWDAAIAAGKVAAADLVETWITTLDGRERPTHHEMNGTQKAYNEHWFVPGIGRQRYPGESEYNCRCRTWIAPRIRRASAAGGSPVARTLTLIRGGLAAAMDRAASLAWRWRIAAALQVA